jgi:hypothetical protein
MACTGFICDWQTLIAGVIGGVIGEQVPQERRDSFCANDDFEQRRKGFKPAGPRLAEYELMILVDTVDRLEEGEITSIRADGIIAALSLVRLTLRSEPAAKVARE